MNRTVKIVAIVVGVLILLVIAIPFFIDANAFRPRLESELTALGKDVEVHHYPGVGHAFFNEDRPEVYHRESAELLWDRTVAFFRQKLS